MTKHLVILGLLFAPFSAAWAGSARIFRLFPDQHRVFATFTGDVQEGSQMTATFPNGSSCPIFVSRIKGRNASLDTSKCPDEASLRVGQTLHDESPDLEMAEVSRPASRASAHDVLDLMYTPKKGHLAITGQTVMGQPKSSISFSSGDFKVYDDAAKTTDLGVMVTYGITDQFSAGVKMETATTSHQLTFGPGSTQNGLTQTQNSSGMTDPTLMGSFRAMEQGPSPVDLDLGIQYSPKMGSATTPEGSSNGNEYRGGDLMRLSAQAGQKRDRLQFAGELSYTMYGQQNQSTAVSNAKGVNAAYNALAVEGMIQYDVHRFVAVRGFLGETSTSSQSQTINNSPNIAVNSHMQMHLGAAALIPAVPHKLLVTLQMMDYLAVTETGTIGTASPASGTESDMQMSAAITYEF